MGPRSSSCGAPGIRAPPQRRGVFLRRAEQRAAGAALFALRRRGGLPPGAGAMRGEKGASPLGGSDVASNLVEHDLLPRGTSAEPIERRWRATPAATRPALALAPQVPFQMRCSRRGASPLKSPQLSNPSRRRRGGLSVLTRKGGNAVAKADDSRADARRYSSISPDVAASAARAAPPIAMLSSQQVNADLLHLIGGEATERLVGCRPVEATVRPDDIAVKRDPHRIGHASHQNCSSR